MLSLSRLKNRNRKITSKKQLKKLNNLNKKRKRLRNSLSLRSKCLMRNNQVQACYRSTVHLVNSKNWQAWTTDKWLIQLMVRDMSSK